MSMNKKIKPLVVGPKQNNFSSIEEMDALNEKFNKVTEGLDEGGYARLPSSYTYTAKPYVFPIKKKDVVKLHRGKDDVTQIPEFLTNKEKLLLEAYDAVIIEGEVYSTNHPDIAQAKDTENYDFKKNLYKLVTSGYCEKKDSLVELPHMDGYAFEDEVTKAYDTNQLELKRNLYKWKGEDGEVRHYKYQQLSPDARKQRIYFEEAIFPSAEDINETRVGIELEYSKAIEATRKALPRKQFRENWMSIRDGSIPSEGTEFVSVPFSYDQFQQIENFMRFCEKHGARINKSCGFHVHVGSPDLDFVSLTNVVTLCQNIQKDLFKLVSENRKNNEYCKPLDKTFRGFNKVTDNSDEEEVANIFYEDVGVDYNNRHKKSKYSCNQKRHYWLSIDRYFRFKEEPHKRTVEFRMHHATHDPDEFMQFVYLCYYIVQFCIEKTIADARSAELQDVVNWIPNRSDQRKVEELLTTKKVLEYAN